MKLPLSFSGFTIMAYRLYLIPIETDEEILRSHGLAVAPKYLSLLDAAVGNLSIANGYYIVKPLEGYHTDFERLESMPDVIRIDQNLNTVSTIQALSGLGINMTGIGPESPVTDIEKRVIAWLDGREDTDFRGLNKIDGE